MITVTRGSGRLAEEARELRRQAGSPYPLLADRPARNPGGADQLEDLCHSRRLGSGSGDRQPGREGEAPAGAVEAQPDQVVSYYFWAEDLGPDNQPRRTSGDMYFAEVRHFEEIFGLPVDYREIGYLFLAQTMAQPPPSE